MKTPAGRRPSLLLAAALVLAACAIGPSPRSKSADDHWDPSTMPDHCGPQDSVATNATLYGLIAHPAFFNGCRVRVLGFFGAYQTSSARLYLSREDRQLEGNLFGSVKVKLMPHKGAIDFDKMRAMIGKVVEIDGHFVDRGRDEPLIEAVEEVNIDVASGIRFPGSKE